MSILGQHTIAELKYLLLAKDYEHKKIAELYGTLTPAQKASDPTWAADWSLFLARYTLASAPGRAAIAVASVLPAPDKTIPAENEWKAVLRSLTKTEGAYTDQDEQGLFNRLLKMGAVVPKDWHVPQPPKDDDIDLDVFKAATNILPKEENLPWLYVAAGAALALGLVFVIRR